MARDTSYFQEIEQVAIHKGGYTFVLPIFHYDSASFGVALFANYAATKALLPSPRLDPFSLPLGRTIIILAGFEHRDCELGVFNEYLTLVPIRNPADGGWKAWFLPWRRPLPSFYVLHFISGSPKANTIFKEVFNFPAIDGNVNIERTSKNIRCTVSSDNDFIVSTTIPSRESGFNNVLRFDLFTVRSDRVLRSEIIGSVFGMQVYFRKKVKVEVGADHFICRDLNDLKLGRPLAAWYVPHTKFIFTNPIESLSFQQF